MPAEHGLAYAPEATPARMPAPPKESVLARFIAAFYALLGGLSALALVATFATVMLGVVAREAGWDIPGLDGYAGYFIAAALFLGLPGALRNGDHIRVSLLLDRLPPRARAAFEWWGLGAAFVLACYLAWYSARLVWVSYAMGDVSPSADATPLWIPQISMALGCAGFALSFGHALFEQFRGRSFIEVSDEISHVE